MDAFAQRKAATLQELLLDAGDFSRAGHVDQRAKAIVGLVNRHKDFYTTSSCSGRVSLFADPTTSTKAGGLKGGEWVYVSHEPAEAGAIVAAVREKLGEDPEDEDECEKKANETSQGIDPECSLVLRFEPFILSVEASSVEHGGRFVAAARDAGFRESGITGNDRRVVCSIRCSIRMETHVVSRGVRLVSDLAIRELVRIANEKWNANKLRAERLEETIARVFGREMDPGTSVGVSGTYDSPKLVHDVSPSDEQSHHVANSVSARHQWVFTVDPLRAKRCKDCLKNMNWLDKKRKAGIGAEGKVLLPITLEGAQILRDAVTSWESDVDPESPYVCVVQALQHGVAAVAESATGGDGETPVLAARIEFKNPAALIRQAALSIAVAAPTGKGSNVFGNEIPTKWEKLGSLALLPSDAFRSETLWPSATRAKLYGAVSLALGVTRLARQAEVSQGPKRESRAEMLWDPANAGGWVDTKELGVWYGLDVTKVMFSSGNGTEKQRMGKIAAAGETVVDLFAGIGYYTLQLLHHSGVAKVVACEWNPHSVEALRKNLVKNGFDETRCEVREGDNRRVAPTGVADRVLLGLLPDSERAWPTAVAALRDSGGVLHVHGNCASGEESVWVKRLEEEVSAAAASLGREWSVRVEHVERVKWYAPRVRHLVADVRCVPARLTSAWAHAVGASTSTSPGSTPTATGGGGARVSSYEHNLAQSQSPGPRSAHKPPSGFNVLTPGVVKTRISVFESPDHSEPNSPSANVSFRDISARTRRDGLNRATEKEKSVRRMHRPSRESFALGPLNQREPCVLTGLDVGSAPWTWSPSHLLAKPAVADHEISVHVSQSPHLDFVRKNFTFENVKFGDLLRKLEGEKDGKKTWYYLRSIGRNPRKEPAHALTQFPDLAKELSIPGDVLWGAAPGEVTDGMDEKYFSSVLRCSSGGCRLWTHYDAMDNALIQLHGEKRVLLFPPSVAAGLYLDGSSSPIVGPEVDGEGIPYAWPKQFPAYKAARQAAIEVILQPGDVLFIPALWAHHTEALHGPSIAVNVFWRELRKDQYPSKDLYGNADPICATEALVLCQAAAQKLSTLPPDHKAFYGGVAASRLLRDLRVEERVASTVAVAFSKQESTPGSDFEPAARFGPSPITENASRTSPGPGPGGVFAYPVYWSDALKGVALGIALAAAWRRLAKRE